jgi:hypothetical protein
MENLSLAMIYSEQAYAKSQTLANQKARRKRSFTRTCSDYDNQHGHRHRIDAFPAGDTPCTLFRKFFYSRWKY